jgi:hypothetical protein
LTAIERAKQLFLLVPPRRYTSTLSIPAPSHNRAVARNRSVFRKMDKLTFSNQTFPPGTGWIGMSDDTLPIHTIELEILRLLAAARAQEYEVLAYLLSIAALEIAEIKSGRSD